MNFHILKQRLADMDKRFKNKYMDFDINKIRPALFSITGLPVKLKRLDDDEINNATENLGIVGVDGSINSYGGIYPHYISLIGALAKSTMEKEDIVSQDIYVPLFEEDDGQDRDESKRRSRMSKLELEVASKAIDTFKSRVILMDGSLMHYSIDCPKEWESFKEKALSSGRVVIGVTEEVKTKDIANMLFEEIEADGTILYDRELLFGLLEMGEMLVLSGGKKTKKAESGIRSCYVRLSEDPQVEGLDFIEEQYEEALKYCNLIYTLTPRKGRGIPLWLDIVDKEVKITDEMVKTIVESSLSREIRERILNPKRGKRG